MARAATEVMQSILFSALLDAVDALKASSKGVPNTMLRDLNALHRNTAYADLPKELQDALAQSTRAAFTAFLKEGYAVGPKADMQASRPMDRVPERERRGPGPDRRLNRRTPGRRDDSNRGPRPTGPGRPGGPGKPRPPKA